MASEPAPLSTTGGSALAPDQAHGAQARSEFVTAFFHGTRTGLGTGDLITPGFASNYGKRKVANWQGHSPEALAAMKGNLQRLKEQGIEHIDD